MTMINSPAALENDTTNWSPLSWKYCPRQQQVFFKNQHVLEQVWGELSAKPSIVTFEEINLLRRALSSATRDFETFFLQIGDCAERFLDATDEITTQKCLFYEKCASLLSEQLHKNVTVIGRIAGQFAKPRSETSETCGKIHIPVYRGDLYHDHDFNPVARKTDPNRFLVGYDFSQKICEKIRKDFPEIYTSHEALELDYESALIRRSAIQNSYFSSSGHFLWLGERTRQLGGAHVEFLRGIHNPIGIKIGPHFSLPDTILLIKILNPKNELGKIVLITRLGYQNVAGQLPQLIQSIKKEKLAAAWFVDPMHGNTQKNNDGQKFRVIGDILDEVFETQRIHQQFGTRLSGIHLESTFENVFECQDNQNFNRTSLQNECYTSYCDPRLNHDQTLQVLKNCSRWLREFSL